MRIVSIEVGAVGSPPGGTGKVVRVERPRRGLRILCDRWDVPHVYGKTRADIEFGAGYASVEDRYVFMEQLRGGPDGPAALDVPGIDPFALATSGRQFVPTEATEQRLNEQRTVVREAGLRGRQFLADAANYVAGSNPRSGGPTQPTSASPSVSSRRPPAR